MALTPIALAFYAWAQGLLLGAERKLQAERGRLKRQLGWEGQGTAGFYRTLGSQAFRTEPSTMEMGASYL